MKDDETHMVVCVMICQGVQDWAEASIDGGTVLADVHVGFRRGERPIGQTGLKADDVGNRSDYRLEVLLTRRIPGL